MTTVTLTDPSGTAHTLEAVPGESVMDLAVQHGIPGIIAECGGALTCSSCHVYVDPEWADQLPETGSMEDEMLDEVAAERTPWSRLSCQIKCAENVDGLSVTIAPRQL